MNRNIIILGATVVLATINSLYMYFLRAPSVVATRPELTEIGWWTALFSGRFMAWLWYHEPSFGVVYSVVLAFIVAVLGTFVLGGS